MAALACYGVHELIKHQDEVGSDVGWFGSTADDPGISTDSSVHHKGAVGSVFALMFGYAVKMEWNRILVHSHTYPICYRKPRSPTGGQNCPRR